MKILSLFAAIVTMFCPSSFAQRASAPLCPTIVVYGPASVVNPGDFGNFDALIKGDAPSRVKYLWKVQGSKVSEGQGTSSIRVQVPRRPPIFITAIVEIGGLPDGCKNTASETFAESIEQTIPEKLGEISNSNYRIENRLIKNVEKSLVKQPDAQIFITLQFAKDTSMTRVNRAERLLLRQFSRKISERIVFVTAVDGGHGGVIWLVPPGADRPTS